MAWENEIAEIKAGKLTYRWLQDCGIPGTSAFIATLPSLPMPVGQLWYRWNTRFTIGIMNIYVIEQLRRQGIATYLHQKLCELAEPRTMYTMAANPMSEPLLMGLGYKKIPDGFYLKVK